MAPPPEAALPPVPLQPGTGILSHEYQEQKVLPRMVRVASLPQKKAPGDARQAAAAMTAPAPQTMTVAAVSTADRDERQAFAAAPEEWRRLAREAEEIFGLDAGLVLAVIQAESSFDHTAVSPVGAQGAMQIMPHTQEELGLIDPFDPRANVYAGSQYLMHQLQRFGSVELALAAYNAGPGSVEQYGGIPPFPETQEFVRRVLVYWNRNIPADQPTHS
ncbi:lytic transglycosylase domain-containing protein [Desulfovibrio piger]|uniref:lytic transglycosylase domain-containing protein n=1 Tax=Desulfovibrio piger TaxID=901 RepID=UPI00266544ED|nr:lytic transglycosylase domain-containing protein [Desulfovibrio piger]